MQAVVHEGRSRLITTRLHLFSFSNGAETSLDTATVKVSLTERYLILPAVSSSHLILARLTSRPIRSILQMIACDVRPSPRLYRAFDSADPHYISTERRL